jgi:hypothetical protein
VARLLSCPHCRAEFAFEDWARAAACPACGQRLSFFEASAQAAPPDAGRDPAQPAGEVWDPLPEVRPAPGVAPAGEPASSSEIAQTQSAGESATPAELWTWSAPADAPPFADDTLPVAGDTLPVAGDTLPVAGDAPPAAGGASVPVPPRIADVTPATPAGSSAAAPLSYPVAAPPPGGHIYTMGGKALQWSRGWTVLVVVWAIVAVALVATRVDMGRLTVMTPGESAAIAAVRQIRQPTGASTETVLRYAATHDLNLEGHIVRIKPHATQMWYAFDRSWEHRIYVYYELPGVSLIGTNADLSWSVTNGVATANAATRVALAKAAQTMAHPPSANSVRPIPGIIPSLPPDLQ